MQFIFSLLFLFLWQSIFTAPAWTQDDALFKKLALEQDQGVVEDVKDTATIVLSGGRKIGMIGLKPLIPPDRRRKIERDEEGKVIKDTTPFKSLEEEAFGYVESLLQGQQVRLEFDMQRQGENFETLAYVFLPSDQGEILVNAEVLRQGFASLSIRPPNTKYAQQLREAYQEARQEKRGLQGE